MKANIQTTKEVELIKIIVKAGVRYWNDCSYSIDNGKTWIKAEEDTEEESDKFKNAIPFVKKEDIGYHESDYWNIIIDINTGIVENWPKDFCISTWFKICDDGLYQILDTEDNVVWDSIKTKYYYVPPFLDFGDKGYGDYINIDIDGTGKIKNWESEGIDGILEVINNKE